MYPDTERKPSLDEQIKKAEDSKDPTPVNPNSSKPNSGNRERELSHE